MYGILDLQRSCPCLCQDATCEWQATFRSIEDAGLLLPIINKLECLQHILQCSAVSRSWRVASQLVRPVALIIPGRTPSLDTAGLVTVLHWVQRKQQRGELQVLSTHMLLHLHIFALALHHQVISAL